MECKECSTKFESSGKKLYCSRACRLAVDRRRKTPRKYPLWQNRFFMYYASVQTGDEKVYKIGHTKDLEKRLKVIRKHFKGEVVLLYKEEFRDVYAAQRAEALVKSAYKSRCTGTKPYPTETFKENVLKGVFDLNPFAHSYAMDTV